MKYSREEVDRMVGNKIVLPAEEALNREVERSWIVKDRDGNDRRLDAIGETIVYDMEGINVDDWVFYPALTPGPDQEVVPGVACAPRRKLREWAADNQPQRLVNLEINAIVEIADFEKDEVLDGYRRKKRSKEQERFRIRDIHQQCRGMLGYFGMDMDPKSVHRLYCTLQKAAEDIFKKINLADALKARDDVKVIDGFTDAGARLNVKTDDGKVLPMNKNAYDHG